MIKYKSKYEKGKVRFTASWIFQLFGHINSL